MNEQEMKRLAQQLAEATAPDGSPLFSNVWDQCPSSAPDGAHPNACVCGGKGSVITLDLNRWLIAIGTGAEFLLLPTNQWICTIPQTTSQSMYQPTPIAALLEAVQQAVQGL